MFGNGGISNFISPLNSYNIRGVHKKDFHPSIGQLAAPIYGMNTWLW